MSKVKAFTAKLPHYWKTVAFVLGAATALGPDVAQAIADGGADGNWSTQDTYRVATLAVTGFVVYRKRNRPHPIQPQD